MKAIFLGILASLFFAVTFVLNRQMNISGGNWIWSAALRYIFMLPMLLIIVVAKNQFYNVTKDIIKRPVKWVLWSTVGFGLFYAPLTFASIYGSSWLVAGTWQITIAAGAILSPLFFRTIHTKKIVLRIRNKIPKKSLLVSLLILFGIFLMQLQNAKNESISKTIIGIIPVIIAAFAYPLGNRKMMEICGDKFNTFQRVYGMTLASMPFWIALSVFAISSAGLPSNGQIIQSLIVALCSGVVATILFFKATDIVKNNMHKLAIVEATQSGEVIFTLIGGLILFRDKVPTAIGFIGIAVIIIGMILNSLMSI